MLAYQTPAANKTPFFFFVLGNIDLSEAEETVFLSLIPSQKFLRHYRVGHYLGIVRLSITLLVCLKKHPDQYYFVNSELL